jgi:uncharacterized protein YndB with AHSA1/START domain
MTVRDVIKDVEALTLTLTAEFDAPVERLWQVLADARQLERWWGPPDWPATFTRHDMVTGGESRYAMTGPEGETMPGWWRFTAVEEPHRLAFEDGFADENGDPIVDTPVIRCELTLAALPDRRTLLTSTSWFSSLEAFEELEAMGMEEGNSAAMGQIDAILAEG